MKIGVDAGCLGIQDINLQNGVYQVAKCLLESLGKMDRKNTYILYSFYPIKKEVLMQFGPNFINRVITPVRGWSRVWLPIVLQIDRPEIFLGLSQFIPATPFLKIKKIPLVFDIAFERYPSSYPDSFQRLHRNSMALIKSADKIITISESTKDDLLSYYHADPEKIIVSYPGIPKRNKRKVKNNVQKPYFLSVGALKRSKNIPVLLNAFISFQEQIKKEYMFYIVGTRRWLDPYIQKVLDSLPEKIQRQIVFLGFVTDDALVDLYANATAFMSSSMFEGFGFPFIEAMKYGCPVIASNEGSIPEIVQDAAILVRAQDMQGFSEGMIDIVSHPKLAQRLREKGLLQAKKFTWNKFAKDILHAMQERN